MTVAETGTDMTLGWKYCEKRKVFNLALKDDRVEQCLRSCGIEFQMRGPKQEKVHGIVTSKPLNAKLAKFISCILDLFCSN